MLTTSQIHNLYLTNFGKLKVGFHSITIRKSLNHNAITIDLHVTLNGTDLKTLKKQYDIRLDRK